MFREIRTTLGISLSIIGVPLGMYLNWFFPVVKWSPLTMLLSVVLIANWRNVLRLRLAGSASLAWIVGFQMLMVLYGVLDARGAMTGQYFSFHAYVIMLCVAYASLNASARTGRLCDTLYLSSLVLTGLGAWTCYSGLVVGDEVWQMKQEVDDYALEPFTVASGVLTNLFAALLVRKERFWEKLLFLVAVSLDVYVLFACTKRTPIFVAIVGTLLYLYKRGILTWQGTRRFLKYVPLLIIAFVGAYATFSSFATNVNDFVDNFYAGVLNLMGDTSVRDASGSAMARTEARQFMFTYISTHFTPVNYIFGAGYLFRWLDAPVLEAYLDMGIPGFVGYAFIIIVLPFKALRRRWLNDGQLLALMLCIYPLVSCFNSGNPYGYNKYTATCLMVYLIGHYTIKRAKTL